METVRKVVREYMGEKAPNNGEFWMKYIDTDFSRVGQDVRYALNDNKLRNLGWKSKRLFDYEIPNIVKHYKE